MDTNPPPLSPNINIPSPFHRNRTIHSSSPPSNLLLLLLQSHNYGARTLFPSLFSIHLWLNRLPPSPPILCKRCHCPRSSDIDIGNFCKGNLHVVGGREGYCPTSLLSPIP